MSEHRITISGASMTNNLELALALKRLFEQTNGTAEVYHLNGSVTVTVSCNPVELRHEFEIASEAPNG